MGIMDEEEGIDGSNMIMLVELSLAIVKLKFVKQLFVVEASSIRSSKQRRIGERYRIDKVWDDS